MHIAFLTPEYPHERVAHAAGIGTSIKNLVVALSNEKIKVSVFVYGQQEDAVLIEQGITIHLIKNRKYKFMGWYFHRKYLQNYLNKYILYEQIDAVEAPDWTGITAFMHLKAPLVIRFHGSDTYFCHIEKRHQKAKNFWFEKLATKKAKAFIAPTTYAGNVSKELFGIKNKRVQTIHYGLELSLFENPNPKHFEKGLLLYIGTIIRKKGVFELPEIFKKVRMQFPDAKLILIGGDSSDVQTGSHSTWQLLQKEFDPHDLEKVSYLGKIPYQDIQNYIKQAHVCIFPSFAETLGMVTIESMALQKPVVNTNIGWAQELIVDGESGFLVHPQDHTLYADRILELLVDTNLCLTMGGNARKRVEAVFDIEKIAEQNILFYQSIIGKS
ncbi:glycosyltransferase family 4 protein [Flavobacterium glaciei]|uniref:Glycosyltransferase involved in cell wall biosynthesis n=1 Tax=Flavobacterium glaciei TaxID=386300 RepID=A0A562Q5S4_9FLAO|nr:glycosyltransferase family 4 protein [Flavobacterium glaciei]RDI58320.1 glycosyltransferase involved in cell wall biosynthesis [Flavobacterium glaciei]TWI52107.1 glycosyltransferase involved in cell wall biosynthesis [Flavobacterium glaciei]